MLSLFKLIRQTYRMVHHRERRVVMKNVALLSVLQASTYLLPVIVLPYLFRVIGPDKFGLIAFAQAFVQYFIIVTDYGFNISATKEISICRSEHARVCRIFSSVMMAKLLLALSCLLVLGAILYYVPKFRQDWPVYALSFGAVLGSALFPFWFFQGTEDMKPIADLNIISGLFWAVFIFLFVKGPEDYLMVPLITSCSSMLTGFMGQYIVFRRFGVFFEWRGYRHMGAQFRAGWDIFISNAAINAYTTTRVFTVGLLTNNAVTGFYSIAEKVANVFQTFPLYSFSQAVFPQLSKMFHRNKMKAFRVMQRIQQITLLVGLIILPAAFIFSPAIVKIVCGHAYGETVLSLRLLLVAVFFVSANAFRVQFLLVCGKTDIFSRIHVFAAMVGLPLIFLLIESFSYAGAAISTIAIEAMIFTITYLTVRSFKF